ncbi:N-acetylneuraminic acid mutarotase [Mucilaginibacter sp. UYP25]|uniref:Kelch repeat-containing protein n=1 Tax=unclassified Mucilaginibacter TaxID=2617802 RepID=UPI00339AC055
MIYLRIANCMFKKSIILLLVSLSLFSCKKEKPFVPNSTNGLPGLWAPLNDFAGVGRVRAFGFAIGSKGYLLGGNAEKGFYSELLNDLWEYDPKTDKWTKKADYPGQAGEYVRGFAINGKAYVGTGFGQRVAVPGDETPQNNDFWEYDPTVDKWTRKADFAGGRRENVIAFEINGSGYMGLGTNNAYDINYKDFWKYDAAADKWTRVADYPGSGAFGVAAFSANGKGYAGLGGASPNIAKQDFWEYDPAVNKWNAKANFPGEARAFTGQFAIGTIAFLGFGSTLTNTADDWFKYDTVTDKWVKSTNFPGLSRYDMVSFAIDGVGYVGTGNPDLLKDFWKFTPRKVN